MDFHIGDLVSIDLDGTTGVVRDVDYGFVLVASESEPSCALWFHSADLALVETERMA